MYVMVWLYMTTREIIASESMQHPNSAWVVKQTEVFLDQTLSRDEKPSIVMHDRDAKFSKEFVAKLEEHGVRHNAFLGSGREMKHEGSIAVIFEQQFHGFGHVSLRPRAA